jgi:GNAT superfamily N-acetyltransferase
LYPVFGGAFRNLAHFSRGEDLAGSLTNALSACRKVGAKFAENTVQFRLAELTDAERVTNLINIAFRNAEAFLIERDRIDVDSVRLLLEKGKFLLAEEEGILVGCAYIELRGDRSYLGLLSVDPRRQKAGLGSKIMSASEEYSTKAGCRFMDLRIINVRHELPRFYHRLGYVETGTEPLTPDLKPKLPCHFITMSKPLC